MHHYLVRVTPPSTGAPTLIEWLANSAEEAAIDVARMQAPPAPPYRLNDYRFEVRQIDTDTPEPYAKFQVRPTLEIF